MEAGLIPTPPPAQQFDLIFFTFHISVSFPSYFSCFNEQQPVNAEFTPENHWTSRHITTQSTKQYHHFHGTISKESGANAS